jgi:hypothetical protein
MTILCEDIQYLNKLYVTMRIEFKWLRTGSNFVTKWTRFIWLRIGTSGVMMWIEFNWLKIENTSYLLRTLK